MDDRTAPTYRERLWPGPLGWTFVVGFAAVAAVAVVLVDVVAATLVGAATLAVGLVAAVRSSPRVVVADGHLTAGRARIPVGLLAEGTVLDAEGVRIALGPGSDARTYACLRAWIRGATLFRVDDPRDPTPAWLVSSRTPAALLAAVRREQDQGRQAAHSEQIG